MKGSRLIAAVVNSYLNKNILRGIFGIFNFNIEIIMLVENTRIRYFIFGLKTVGNVCQLTPSVDR